METMTYKEYLEWLLERETEKSQQERLRKMIKEMEAK